MSPDDFARFLECLSPDAEEAGRRYIRLHRKLVGFFSMRGVSDPAAAADETVERAAARIAGGAKVPDVEKFCFGIARNVARERWRCERREHSAFLRFVDGLADGSAEEIERIRRVLRPCFEQLAEEDRNLLADYCKVLKGRPRAEHRRALAEALGTTVLALRIRVTRLRARLSECVRKGTENG